MGESMFIYNTPKCKSLKGRMEWKGTSVESVSCSVQKHCIAFQRKTRPWHVNSSACPPVRLSACPPVRLSACPLCERDTPLRPAKARPNINTQFMTSEVGKL